MIDNKKLREIEDDYMKMLSTVNVLEDIDEHLDQIRQGDKELYKLLLNTYMVRIPSIIEKYVDDSLDLVYMDLIQEGNYTLLEKTQFYFDNHLQESFDKYIVKEIEHAIEAFIDEQESYLNMPSEDVENLIKVVHVIEHLKQDLKREPDFNEIKEKLPNLSDEQLKFYLEIKNS